MQGQTGPTAAVPVSATDILLSEGVILLGAAVLFVMLFRRLGLGAVLGYLVAGALVGPQGLRLVGGAESKLAIAEIGIVLLLFLVGLELHPARLWRLKRDIFALGMAQVVLCGCALTAIIFYTTGFTWGAAIALGLPLALSSTAQVLPGLKSSGRINSPFGERVFSILLFQDLSIVPLITIVAALSRNPADAAGPPGWLMAGYTVAAIAGLVLTGRFILRPLLHLVGRLGERELFVVVGLFTVLAAAALMHALHLSTALGAFVAGVMLADSPYRHEIEADVEPFRSILLGLFFLAVGMVLDLHAVAANPLFVIGMAAILVLTKAALITGLARLFGMEWNQAIGSGLLLSQGGEFGFVLFAQAQSALLIAPQAASLFSAIVTFSMATTPFLMLFARKLEFARPKAKPDLPTPEEAPRGTAIIVGYGRFGQTVAQMLMGHGFGVVLIDKKPSQIEVSSRFDMKVYYGDGTRIDLLRRSGAEEARLIAFCIDDPSLDGRVLEPIAEAFPQAALVVRAFDRRQLLALKDMDLAGVVREVFESAICMGVLAMQALGVPPEEVEEVERQYRRNDEQRMALQMEHGNLMAAKELMYRPGRQMRLLARGDGEEEA
ncbi:MULTISPECIES: monovalent cation:proton antiporter-2 (CPA2) family protein [unclassified Sphingobium]|uniref:monovalent cation:proton antiporter-2 (CPA2) family protein n=1 Tax=unclassified Sphingobium TaxID=2611147 RepID=UPI0005CC539F|nr:MULTISPECIES: monovalent cation:proton antiporter-2 (CPA2) family protein [unclassified Sphingobium]AJR25716.1 sodium:proton exchanger [Sphingobium sp. YBL2]UXC92358.1 monovalent cation:proton antiporter-2 (CPA2) family protein [Sphingobium sp. RSMS]